MLIDWIPFDPASPNLPPERRHVLLMIAERQESSMGLPPSCAVGYLRIHSGGPFFVVPGAGGRVTHYADCLGDDFCTPIIKTAGGDRFQMTNGKWGECHSGNSQ